MNEDIKSSSCRFCNGYYDPDSRQSICSVCHSFLYELRPSLALTADSGRLSDEKEASRDSGNEDLPERDQPPSSDTMDCDPPFIPGCPNTVQFANPRPTGDPHPDPQCSLETQRPHSFSKSVTSSCSQPQAVFSAPASSPSSIPISYFPTYPCLSDMPVEVWLCLFAKLDDLSLWSLRQVSCQLRSHVDSNIPESRWANMVRKRWPLFEPHYRVTSWRLLYLNLMSSVSCQHCLQLPHCPLTAEAITTISSMPNTSNSGNSLGWRYRRIYQEVKTLSEDPPYGIRLLSSAGRLDETSTHCLASIEGPPASPYQGGLFYVHVSFPDTYPIRPPIVRFLTRILHPNVSSHGDIGLDCIQHNWSSALTLEKLLISVQSLLTDPFADVCMEPGVGRLYLRDRAGFDAAAQLWTWKFACHDYLSAEFVASMRLPTNPPSDCDFDSSN